MASLEERWESEDLPIITPPKDNGEKQKQEERKENDKKHPE